jgi:hypothetical protein
MSTHGIDPKTEPESTTEARKASAQEDDFDVDLRINIPASEPGGDSAPDITGTCFTCKCVPSAYYTCLPISCPPTCIPIIC